MESREERAQQALDALRQWQWYRCDPDGNPFSPSIELGLVVNRLAIAGQASPQSAVLFLLCTGDLLATGDYQWMKYQ